MDLLSKKRGSRHEVFSKIGLLNLRKMPKRHCRHSANDPSQETGTIQLLNTVYGQTHKTTKSLIFQADNQKNDKSVSMK